jgi:hypothetical protein
VRDDLRGEDHAVVAARLDGNWLMLDDRHMAMVEDKRVLLYRPVFLVDRDGVNFTLTRHLLPRVGAELSEP